MPLYQDIEDNATRVNPLGNIDATYDLALNWFDAIQKGSFELTTSNDQEARKIFVGLQALIEKTIAEQMAAGGIESAVNIIHTPKPVSPFSAAEDDGGYDSSDAFIDAMRAEPDAAGFVELRRKVLSEFMSAGGVVVSAYPKGQDLTAEYETNVAALCGALVDHPLDEFDPAMTGATLVVTEKSGLRSVFSLNAYQAHTSNDGQVKTWRVWFGDTFLNDEALQSRLDAVRHAVTGDDPDTLSMWEEMSQKSITRALG